MDKNQYDVFLETLRRLDKVGVLSKVVLIGSWFKCVEHVCRNRREGDAARRI